MRLVSMNLAASRASSADLTSFTKPALPRPPAYTCALTTHIGWANFLNASAASSGVRQTSAGGTGMPASARIWRAWYSWIFMAGKGRYMKPLLVQLLPFLLVAPALGATTAAPPPRPVAPPVGVPYAADRKLGTTDFERFEWTDS